MIKTIVDSEYYDTDAVGKSWFTSAFLSHKRYFHVVWRLNGHISLACGKICRSSTFDLQIITPMKYMNFHLRELIVSFLIFIYQMHLVEFLAAFVHFVFGRVNKHKSTVPMHERPSSQIGLNSLLLCSLCECTDPFTNSLHTFPLEMRHSLSPCN